MRLAIRPPRTFERVDLYGEASDWQSPLPLAREADGVFSRDLDLPAGVYQYKLAGIDAAGSTHWFVDPQNPRTRASGGHRNSVLAVDAAPEPWLFAPAAPWVEELERGGLRILCGVRGDTVAIAWRDGTVWSDVAVDHAFDEDEHGFWIATIPTTAPQVEIRLATAGREHVAVYRRRPLRERTPAWWADAIVYGVVVERFRPAQDHPGFGAPPDAGTPPRGHLDGVRRSLDAIAALGVDVLCLSPVHVTASDLADPLRVDPRLGGEEAYLALVQEARRRGIRIVQDVTFSHVGRGFGPYTDVLVRGRDSRYAGWFVWRADGEDLVYHRGRTDAPRLDQQHPEVQALALATVEALARRGVKGLRLDAAAEMPIALGQRLRRRFRELVPDGVVIGELAPEHAWRWRESGVVDVATDSGFHALVGKLVGTDPAVAPLPAVEALGRLARSELLRGGDPGLHALRYLSTHERRRLATLAGEAGRSARLLAAYVLLATLPGTPLLLFGEELGLRGEPAPAGVTSDEAERVTMPWSDAGRPSGLREPIQALFLARRSSAALRHGSLGVLLADETTLVFRRELETEIVDVVLSLDSEAKTIELDDDEHPALTPLASIGGASSRGPAILLPPWSALVARRERAHGLSIPPLSARRNLALRDQDLVAGRPEAMARPSRFAFAVTERCNLRCAHCSTRAPELTRTGEARTMDAAVVAALADDLGHGDYFGFGHGGEPLLAPVLFDLLSAIRAARGSAPYVAHVLTNGVLLDRRMVERLVAAGVGSLAVSLDGASAATNDALRLGGRFHDVRENLRAALAWRVREGIDLRIGITSVVLSQNVGELDALVDLAADLGADWVKLEEGVGATELARRSLLTYGAADVRVAIHRAMHRGRSRGLVMVDHTREQTVWRCRLDPATREFLDADEYAGRGALHPCRLPWEAVAIGPDGEARARDFDGPSLGNVTTAPLGELWNGVAARQLRAAAVRARLCGAGPVTCV